MLKLFLVCMVKYGKYGRIKRYSKVYAHSKDDIRNIFELNKGSKGFIDKIVEL